MATGYLNLFYLYLGSSHIYKITKKNASSIQWFFLKRNALIHIHVQQTQTIRKELIKKIGLKKHLL